MTSPDTPLPPRPTIAVIGAGAVGAYYGGRLAQHKHNIHFLLRSDYDAVKKLGWTIQSCHGDFVLRADSLRLHNNPAEMPKADLVIVTLKTTANDQFQPLISPLVKDNTAILTLQNGLGNEKRLAELFGQHRVMGGMAFVCINRIQPGVIHHIAAGQVTLGEWGCPAGARARQVAAMFDAANVQTRIVDDLAYGRWEKLVWNIPFNGLSATLDRTTDLLLGTQEGEELVRALMREVIVAARAADDVALPDTLVDAMVERTKGMGAYKTSSHLDMQAGRPMEIEAIFGYPLRRAEQAGVPTPLLWALYRMLKLRDDKRTDGYRT
jgi:2-dehydropantoate 2-reductase